MWVYHPIMISIKSFPSIYKISTLLTFCYLFRLVNFLYFLLRAPCSQIDSLDSIKLIFFSFIFHTFTMPWTNTILFMRSPIRRIGRLIRSITNTHITQNSIPNPSKPTLIQASLLSTSLLCIRRNYCLCVWFCVDGFRDIVVFYWWFRFWWVCVQVFGENVIWLVGFMGDIFTFESDISR